MPRIGRLGKYTCYFLHCQQQKKVFFTCRLLLTQFLRYEIISLGGNMTKTDNILNIIVLLKNTPHQILHKKEVVQAIGKSRSQTYKILAEFSQPTDQRPAVFTLVGDRVVLNAEYR